MATIMRDHVYEASSIITALVFTGKLDPYNVPLELLHPDFADIINKVREGKSTLELIAASNSIAISDTINRLTNIAKEMSFLDGITASPAVYQHVGEFLQKAHTKQKISYELKSTLDALNRGEQPDFSKLSQLILENNAEFQKRIYRMDEIDNLPQTTFRRTYYDPIDESLFDPMNPDARGIPEASLIVIGAGTGVGKTSLATKLAASMAVHEKKVAFFTLEMTPRQISNRILQSASSYLLQANGHTNEEKDKIKKHVYISDNNFNLSEIIETINQLCNTIKDLYAIVIDFMDLLVHGEQDEQKVSLVYKELARLARSNPCHAPIILLSQFSRQAVGEIPQINFLRYSGLAEAMAAVVILLYNPKRTFTTEPGKSADEKLPIQDGKAWIIFGKSRFGYGLHNRPFAVCVDFYGKESWGDVIYDVREL